MNALTPLQHLQHLPFAATKIQLPRQRRRRLARPALEAALIAALAESRLLLLQAPAGYGKTSLLASLPQGLAPGAALAWVSFDEDDDDQRFFACLCAALEPHDLPWRIAPEALAAQLGNDDPGGGGRALAELVNALAGADVNQGVIVLDDLHRVESGRIHALLEGLIERLPAPWVMVLSSRVLPPLPLARWRAAGELVLFDQERLAFSADEAAALAVAEGAPDRAAELFERTRGWPAGLRLLLAAPVRAGVRGALDREVFDFLASEVLDDMPLALHDFLLRVSVLPELTVERAAAVSGDARAAERFDEIERRGLFSTALEADERTLVLHDLFRQALLDRLRRRWPQQEAQLLHRAAESEPDPVRRVNFLLRARDWALAELTLAAAAPALLLAGGMRELQRVVAAFDPGWREQSPRLHRLSGLASQLMYDWDRTTAQMQAALAAAERQGDAAERDLAQAYLATALYTVDRNAEAEALIAGLRQRDLAPATRRVMLMADCLQHLRRGQMLQLPALYGEVMALLDGEDDLFAWWECVPPFNWTTIPGMEPPLEAYVQGALQRLGGRPLPMRADVQLLRAFVRLWAGAFDAAREEARAIQDDMRWLACSGDAEVGLQIFRLIDAALNGRTEAVEQHLQTLFQREDNAGDDRRRLWRHQIAIYGVRMNDVLGAGADTLARWAVHLKENPIAEPGRADNARAIAVRARHAAAQQRWADAATGFGRLLPLLGDLDVMGHAMDLRLRAAHTLLQCQRLDEAADALRPALQRLLRDGPRGQALLAGPQTLLPLAEARWQGRLEPPLLDELAACAQLAAQRRGLSANTAPAPDRDEDEDEHRLSTREREVLELMAAGDSNKVIARTLDISPHTVKRHVANILDKLDLASRGQAAAWWRDHA